MKFEINNVWIGMLIAAVVSFVGYGIVVTIFELLVSTGIMDEASTEAKSPRNRTMTLLAICFNIVFIQLFNKRKYTNTQRGVALMTMLIAGIWVYYFKDTLFISE